MKLKFIRAICNKCPCLNRDCESEAECNLGFHTDLIWVHKNNPLIEVKDNKEMRSHQEDFDLIQASDDCELVKIETQRSLIHNRLFNKPINL